MNNIRLKPTVKNDLDFVLQAEANQENLCIIHIKIPPTPFF